MNMKVTNEILAAYAEGNVSAEEQEMVRQYLMQHTSELEKVIAIMDEDYELEPYDIVDYGASVESNALPFSDIALSAAAFAPISKCCESSRLQIESKRSSVRKDSFDKRMSDLLKDIGL